MDNNKQPATFRRLTDYLKDIIKPASMTDKTKDLLEGNAHNWAFTTQLILENHYTEGIEQTLTELENILTPDWQVAFEVATRWSKRKFQRRMTDETIEKAEIHIVSLLKQDQGQPKSKNMDKTKQNVNTQTSPRIQPKRSRGPSRDEEIFSGDAFPPLTTVDTGTSPMSDHTWSPCAPPPGGSPRPQRGPKVTNSCVIAQDDPILELGPTLSRGSARPTPPEKLKPSEPAKPERTVLSSHS